MIRERSSEPTQFSVSLGSYVREEIKDAISWLHRNVGREYETGGFLFGTQRPSAWWDHLTVCLAVTPNGSCTRRSGRGAHSSLELDHLRCCARRQRPCSICCTSVIGTFTRARARRSRRWRTPEPGPWKEIPPCSLARSASSSVQARTWAGRAGLFGLTVRREGPRALPVCEPARLDE